ncbi:hypothetical protein D9611_009599 [Ephemerocybe angulata]|uniref:Uncharacterized protein n=1 Tax=Ephemerocybe angulata TaxID=980116 RepID=A0A8H5C5X0_9AGAR|nr:hypothetical protein D9611_009599 [Tulosesus angulatus]
MTSPAHIRPTLQLDPPDSQGLNTDRRGPIDLHRPPSTPPTDPPTVMSPPVLSVLIDLGRDPSPSLPLDTAPLRLHLYYLNITVEFKRCNIERFSNTLLAVRRGGRVCSGRRAIQLARPSYPFRLRSTPLCAPLRWLPPTMPRYPLYARFGHLQSSVIYSATILVLYPRSRAPSTMLWALLYAQSAYYSRVYTSSFSSAAPVAPV